LATRYRKYPTGLKIQFAQNALSKEYYKPIARSTKQRWKNYNIEQLYVPENVPIYDHENIDLLKALAEIQQCKKIIRGLVYLLLIHKSLLNQFKIEQKNAALVRELISVCVKYLQSNFTSNQFWRWMPFSSHQWSAWNSRKICKISLLSLCRRTHPQQLTAAEAGAIKDNCSDGKYKHWPLVSIYYQLMRDKKLHCSRSTFYKYCRLMNITCLKKTKPCNYEPLTSPAPLKMLHLDVTIYRLLNGTKVYLHVIRDNFSKAILGCKAAANCCSQNSKEILEEVLLKYNLLDTQGTLITDGGSENRGALQEFITKPGLLWKKLIAQLDIVQSNSMVEAANKILKYRFLFHRCFETLSELQLALPGILSQYNNMPLGCLYGLTPSEVLEGKMPDKKLFTDKINAEKKLRMIANQKIICDNTC
jgi:hypothetical protein